eukprot:scaffold910_cov396-Prasinococcus_capsulatus_cf.AAC.15
MATTSGSSAKAPHVCADGSTFASEEPACSGSKLTAKPARTVHSCSWGLPVFGSEAYFLRVGEPSSLVQASARSARSPRAVSACAAASEAIPVHGARNLLAEPQGRSLLLHRRGHRRARREGRTSAPLSPAQRLCS